MQIEWKVIVPLLLPHPMSSFGCDTLFMPSGLDWERGSLGGEDGINSIRSEMGREMIEENCSRERGRGQSKGDAILGRLEAFLNFVELGLVIHSATFLFLLADKNYGATSNFRTSGTLAPMRARGGASQKLEGALNLFF